MRKLQWLESCVPRDRGRSGCASLPVYSTATIGFQLNAHGCVLVCGERFFDIIRGVKEWVAF